MNVFHYTATAAVPGWENSGDPDHNDNDFFREGLIYNIIVCLAVCLAGWLPGYLRRAFHFNR